MRPDDVADATASAPTDAGVYRWWGADGHLRYVGKAANLRRRLADYRRPADAKTAAMLAGATDVDWIVCSSDTEATLLERNLISAHRPPYNLHAVDDTRLPRLQLTADALPKVAVTHDPDADGATYGPYRQPQTARDLLDVAQRVFGIRTCHPATLRHHQHLDRPCLLGDIGRCAAPCLSHTDPADYRRRVDELATFLTGDTGAVDQRLTDEMADHAAHQRFEAAARLRDQRAAVRALADRQRVDGLTDGDLDAVAATADRDGVTVACWQVRGGRVVGAPSWQIDGATAADALPAALTRLGGDLAATVATAPGTAAAALTDTLTAAAGHPVTVRAPTDGPTAELVAGASRQAREQRLRLRSRRASDLTARRDELTALQTALNLDEAPLRIEALDAATLHGQQTVVSVAVLTDGAPDRRASRAFALGDLPEADDPAAIARALTHRLSFLGVDSSTLGRPPQLLLIDGGPTQVAAAAAALEHADVAIPLVGLAKRHEELWWPDAPQPQRLDAKDPARWVLQRARDEAHRVANRFHRSQRGKALAGATLEAIPGVGPARRAALLDAFGSPQALAAADVDDVAAVPGINAELAQRILDWLE